MGLDQRIVGEILKEVERANEIHMPLPIGNPVRTAAILAEEVGEVVSAALDLSRVVTHHHVPENLRGLPLTYETSVKVEKWRNAHLREEIVQVAATAINWLHALDANEITNQVVDDITKQEELK